MIDRREGVRLILLNLQNSGSPPALTRTLVDELNNAGRLAGVIISERNELLERIVSKASPAPVEILKLPERKGRLNSFRNFIPLLAIVLKFARSNSVRDLLIPNIHLYTTFALPLLRILGFRVYSGIHDFEPHEGDHRGFYGLMNLLLCLSSYRVLFFSRSQHALAVRRWPWFADRYIFLKLPTEYVRECPSEDITRRYDFLFFGRIEEYKGIERLLEAFNVVRTIRPAATLHVAGVGRYRCHALDEVDDVQVTKSIRYIPDPELSDIMLGAKVVVLPYNSATQSGVAGIGSVFGCNVVCTPCEGLVEQAQYNPRMNVAADFTPFSFAKAMIESLDGWSPEIGRSTLIIHSGLVDVI